MLLNNGHYHLLGSGGFGVVLKASDGVREVALKLVFCRNQAQADEATASESVLQTLAEDQPNIIRLLHHSVHLAASPLASRLLEGVRSALPYLAGYPMPFFFRPSSEIPVLHSLCASAMELVTGPDLYDWFVDRKPLQEDALRSVFVQLLRAVAHCHAKGVAHRDIKPDNAMVELQPSQLQVKLIDFGGSARGQFVSGPSYKGTPVYAAPELNVGAEYLDLFAADVPRSM